MEISSEPLFWTGLIEIDDFNPRPRDLQICAYIESPPLLNLVDSDDDEIFIPSMQPPSLSDGSNGEKFQSPLSSSCETSPACENIPSLPCIKRGRRPHVRRNSNAKAAKEVKKVAFSLPCLFCNRVFKDKRARNGHLSKAHALQKTCDDGRLFYISYYHKLFKFLTIKTAFLMLYSCT